MDEEKIPGAGDQSQAASVGLLGGPMAKRAVVEMDKRGRLASRGSCGERENLSCQFYAESTRV